MKFLLPTMLTACALLGAGCLSSEVRQAYSGAPQPADKTCTLHVPDILEVRAIDGVPTDWNLRIRKEPVQELILLSGGHRLQVKYYDPTADESRHEIYDAGPFEVAFVGDGRSVYELKYETAKTSPDLRKSGQKVRVWVVQVKPGKPAAAARPPTVSVSAPMPVPAPAAPGAGVDGMKNNWNSMSPAERDAFRKWLLAQP